MTHIRLSPECVECLVKKFSKDYPDNADREKSEAFTHKVLEIVNTATPDKSAPELVEQIESLRFEIFGIKKDFRDIKHHFNELIMSMEREIEDKISSSLNPLETAVKYAMMGNYIDFGAMDKVDEDKLLSLIDEALDISVVKDEFLKFREELGKAENIVYITDNCGEVVFDKLLMKTIKECYPRLHLDIIVRGKDVLNDATEDDAEQVGLYDIADVTNNGTAIAGTCLDRISEDARNKINNADVIIAKGQGNFETLRYCGLNIYYIFMCKCTMFAERFKVPRFSGMFINDLRLE